MSKLEPYSYNEHRNYKRSGKVVCEFHGKWINYVDKKDAWKNIDLKWRTNQKFFVMDKAPYTVKVPKVLGDKIRFINDNKYDHVKREPITDPEVSRLKHFVGTAAVAGKITDEGILYKGAYPAWGADVILQPHEQEFRYLVKFNKHPDPNGDSEFIEVPFIQQMDEGLEMVEEKTVQQKVEKKRYVPIRKKAIRGIDRRGDEAVVEELDVVNELIDIEYEPVKQKVVVSGYEDIPEVVRKNGKTVMVDEEYNAVIGQVEEEFVYADTIREFDKGENKVVKKPTIKRAIRMVNVTERRKRKVPKVVYKRVVKEHKEEDYNYVKMEKGNRVIMTNTARIWDSPDDELGDTRSEEIKIKGKIKGNKFIAKKMLPRTFFDKATYPVYTDAVDTFYSTTGAASPMDGYVRTDHNTSSWSTCRNASSASNAYGGIKYDTTSDNIELGHTYTYPPNNRRRIARSFLHFDTASLGGAVPSDGTLECYLYQIYNDDNDGYDYIVVTSSSPASDSTLVAADYNDVGSTKMSDSIDVSNMSTGGYETWTLNASGLSHVDPDGLTRFGTREGHDMDNHAIKVGNNNDVTVRCYSADRTGTSEDPKLTLTYVAAVNIVPSIICT